MRFVLDNDVDVRVGKVLRQAGHQCWTADEAGLAGPESAEDDAITVYATDKNAVVITHDREFTARRKRHTVGKHVRFKCEQPDAVAVVQDHLQAILSALETYDELVVEVSRHGVRSYPPRWD